MMVVVLSPKMFDLNRNKKNRCDFESMAVCPDPFAMNSYHPKLIRENSAVGNVRKVFRDYCEQRTGSKIITSLVSLKLNEFCNPDASETSTDFELLLCADCSAKGENSSNEMD